MKRLIWIGGAVLLIVAMVYFTYEFRLIPLRNEPYLSNRQQFQHVFLAYQDQFDQVAEIGKNCSEINFRYNASLGDEQVYSAFEKEDLAENVLFLIKNAGMTNFQKTDDRYFCVYQYAPVIFSDITIGAKYDYQKKTWIYVYHHDYSTCTHNNKLVYRVYDVLFNAKKALLP